MDVREKYNGLKLKRILDTCWSGYSDCIKVINSKIKQIIDCSKEYIRTTSVQSEHKVACKTCNDQACYQFFLLMKKFLCGFLEIVNFASQALQPSYEIM